MKRAVSEDKRRINLEKTREILRTKYGKDFDRIPIRRQERLPLEEIGKHLGVTREQIRTFLLHHFPKDLHPRLPPDCISSGELGELIGLGKAKTYDLRDFFKPYGIYPKGKIMGKNFWDKEIVIGFFEDLIYRPCLNCGEPIGQIDTRRKYCEQCC